MAFYFSIIKEAVLFFPAIAALFTLPYMIYNYHKYGSVLSMRIVIVYSFILYMICAYFLVILPLPSREAVAQMTGARAQLIPFHFISDVITEAHKAAKGALSVMHFINNKAVFQVVFNILMTMPFGMYLRYYFKCSLKKTVCYSFLLSLFFELTQLTGLYFYYPRSYRLFDMDDLMANTFGGLLGYLTVKPFLKVFPTREQIDRTSFRRGREVSFVRRLTAGFLDVMCLILWEVAGNYAAAWLPVQLPWLPIVLFFCYFLVFAICMKGATPGKRITRIRVATSKEGKTHWYQYVVRYVSVAVVFCGIPFLLLQDWNPILQMNVQVRLVFFGAVAGMYLFYLMFACIMEIMHKPLFYEKLSGTKIISTIVVEEPEENLVKEPEKEFGKEWEEDPEENLEPDDAENEKNTEGAEDAEDSEDTVKDRDRREKIKPQDEIKNESQERIKERSEVEDVSDFDCRG